MDPWTAVQCASAALGIIDVTKNVLSLAYQAYTGSSSLQPTLDELRADLKRLRTLQNNLETKQPVHGSRTDAEISELSQECNIIITSLIDIIDKICKHEEKGPNVWTSLKEAVGTLWNRREIEELQRRLERHQQKLPLLMIAACRTEQAETHDTVKKIAEKLEHGTLFKARFTDDNFTEDLLAQLAYEEMDDRYDSIREPHKDTASWIFRRESLEDEHHFVRWLEQENPDSESESDIFWITGKPGSGKSTLMKFIVNAKNTSSSLRKWAGERPMLLLSTYFWISGEETQRSKAGFLRLVLYEAIKQHRDLGAQVFQERLRTYRILGPFIWKENPWTAVELERLMRRLMKTACKTMKVAMFVDGLDEYGDDPKEIIDLLEDLCKISATDQAGSTLKLCISSRFWPEFQARFSYKPKIRMEDRNGPDIQSYVTSTLRKHPRWNTISRDRAEKLNTDIVTMAEGVFLWAHLVTQMLTDALDNGDGAEELGVILYSLPLEFSQLFGRILGSLETDPEGFRKASRLLEIVLGTWNSHLSAMEIFYALSDPEEISRLSIQELGETEREEKIEQVKWMVAARTKCLLQVTHGSDRPNWFDKPRIQFIHRTVGDYLKQTVVRQKLEDAIGPEESFNPLERLALAQLARLKTCFKPNWHPYKGRHDMWMLSGINYMILAHPGDTLAARNRRDRFIKEIASTSLLLLESLFGGVHALGVLLRSTQWPKLRPCSHVDCWQEAFSLDVAARFGLHDYLQANLNQIPLKCRGIWGTYLFALQNAQTRVVSLKSEKERQAWMGLYLDRPELVLESQDRVAGKEIFKRWQRDEKLRTSKAKILKTVDWIKRGFA
ncbi:hypothetical protein QBC38DRAFT_443947 [Podospora fimiseda]|uniref:NACHT domain-containing protein n=1 Tax=Podospora fimiseda TaxID=252190 RepID=A0AAN7BPL7_9PEZI|nr:hypothetical protein QBC38DRAFT_443947 [Podospora fimiseda]